MTIVYLYTSFNAILVLPSKERKPQMNADIRR